MNPYIHYCSLWCATGPKSLFFADSKANELSDTRMAIFLFPSCYTCLQSSPGNLLLQSCCLLLCSFWSKSSTYGIFCDYVIVWTHLHYAHWQTLTSWYCAVTSPSTCLCSWKVKINGIEAWKPIPEIASSCTWNFSRLAFFFSQCFLLAFLFSLKQYYL